MLFFDRDQRARRPCWLFYPDDDGNDNGDDDNYADDDADDYDDKWSEASWFFKVILKKNFEDSDNGMICFLDL